MQDDIIHKVEYLVPSASGVVNQARSESRWTAVNRKILRTLESVSEESKEHGVKDKNARLWMLVQCFREVNSLTASLTSVSKAFMVATGLDVRTNNICQQANTFKLGQLLSIKKYYPHQKGCNSNSIFTNA